MKPKLFIASSKKGLKMARAIQAELKDTVQSHIWDQGFFPLSTSVLETFEERFTSFDFAAFVFLPEDATRRGKQTYKTVRDNVILELGFAIGRLGRKRCFVVSPEKKRQETDFHMPTDLQVTCAEYDPTNRSLQSALGPACTQIREAIRNARAKDRLSPDSNQVSPQRFGMQAIWYPISGKAVLDRLSGARSIRIAKTWFPEDPTIADGLKAALARSSKIEMLLCEPDSEILKIRSEGAGERPARAGDRIEDGIRIVYEAVLKKPKLRFSIDFYDTWPGVPVIRAGSQIFMGFYFLGDSSPHWPWVEVRPKSELAKILGEQWRELWKRRKKGATLDSKRKLQDWLRRRGRL